jgi:sec-independent protein translocase protein TatC
MPRDQDFDLPEEGAELPTGGRPKDGIDKDGNLDSGHIEVSRDEPEATEEQKQMTFMDHLSDLRNMILWIIGGVALAAIVGGIYIEEIINYVLLLPAKNAGMKLQNQQPYGQVYFFFKTILWAGVVLSLPHTLYQIWRFVEPALYKNEKSWAKTIVLFTTFCFISGITFAYFVMLPPMLSFASGFGSDLILNLTDINMYWDTIMMVILAAGLFFEMPMVSYVLSRGGMLSPGVLRKYRRHSIVIILILAAIITPSPDPLNQTIVAGPIYILYEISILISAWAFKKYAEPLT